MTLIIERNVNVDIYERMYTCEEEERYENVSNIYMQSKQAKTYTKNGVTNALLILFNDDKHKGSLNKNYVYLFDKDTMRVE